MVVEDVGGSVPNDVQSRVALGNLSRNTREQYFCQEGCLWARKESRRKDRGDNSER